MLNIRNLIKKYKKGSETFVALDDVSFDVEKGDFITITGHSGSGKSTLLHSVGGLTCPDSGSVRFKENDIYSLGSKQLDDYRKYKVGFIFQQFHLLPYLTVSENIKMACRNERQFMQIDRYLSECSLSGQKNKFPSELSVGEKQRTAFIRAIISNPELLLADEPTGNLDPENSAVIMELINDFNRNGGTVLLVSHHEPPTNSRTRSFKLQNGKLKEIL